MEKPGYRGDWNEEAVAEYLLSRTTYTRWSSEDGNPPAWIKEDGSEWEMMDDIDDRWYAVWKFVADRGEVDRQELAAEFSHLCWSD